MRKALMLTDVSGNDAIYCALKAEESRAIESIWIPEMTRRDSISILGGLAVRTKRIRIAPAILNVYSRTPALIAMSLATLQELSNGRVIAGLSTGNPDYVRDVHGLNLTKSIERLRETVTIIRESLASGTENFSYDGEIFKVRKWSPKFPRIKDIPIYVGAHNPGLLEFVGEACDGVILNLVSSDNLSAAIELIRKSATQHGRSPNSVDIASIIMIAIDNDRRLSERRVRTQIAFYLARSQQIRTRFSKSPFADEIMKIQNTLLKGRLDEIAAGLSRNLVDSIAIYGTKRDAEKRLAEYERAGLNLAIFYVAGWMEDSASFTSNLLESIS
jgi:alkanesulfonate monooxygenase SsuD/methylene tetrahydromethanopterin reductase-like flavin-dependent oxidoreductase (luciferase family)